MTLLSCQQVSFGYEASVLDAINLSFTEGEFVGLIGPNGVGKTTLLSLLNGLLRPQQGQVHLLQQNIQHIERREIARHISFVPQDTHLSYPFSVYEVIAMGRNPYLGRFELEKQEDLAAIQAALEQTDLLSKAQKRVTELSGGERQRVMIARAIAQQTPIILLDEATANLDVAHQLDILNLLQGLKHQGRLVIASIHDLAMASRYCDRLVLLHGNRVVEDGAPQNVITEDKIRAYFGVHAEILLHEKTQTRCVLPIKSV